jgi:hypothetical protein
LSTAGRPAARLTRLATAGAFSIVRTSSGASISIHRRERVDIRRASPGLLEDRLRVVTRRHLGARLIASAVRLARIPDRNEGHRAECTCSPRVIRARTASELDRPIASPTCRVSASSGSARAKAKQDRRGARACS